jgi:hypothetical protein
MLKMFQAACISRFEFHQRLPPGDKFLDAGGEKARASLHGHVRWLGTLFAGFIFLNAVAAPAAPDPNPYFVINVLDDETGRGVPLVELRTVNGICWWTDSAGIVALNEPDLMGQEVFFHVSSPGYEYPKDFFDSRGLKLRPIAGANAEIKLKRLNIAERLYRITGAGIYRDSVLAGRKVPLHEPLLNGQVTGQDTVIATPYRGKLYWFWGDTDRLSYPLGNFGASGAWSDLPGKGGLEPAAGIDLHYFTDKSGFCKAMCPEPNKNLRWIEGLLTVKDAAGQERLVARVAHVRDLGHMEGWYLMVFDDEKEYFEPIQHWDAKEGHDSAHPFQASVNGKTYAYLYPDWRVPAQLEALKDLANYEAYTCVSGDGKLHGGETALDRDSAGLPKYSWKRGGDRLTAANFRKLTEAGKLRQSDGCFQLTDIETGEALLRGRGSFFWNEYEQRWVMIITGKAGEIWFSQADTPTGPWIFARRILTHGQYNFYNPTQHPFFDQEGGRIIYFEGTYTAAFSDAPSKTPRYDYNQIMYRLRLDDPRLCLPVPVYRVTEQDGTSRYLLREGVDAEQAWPRVQAIPFFAVAPRNFRTGLIPVYSVTAGNGTRFQTIPSPGLKPLFYALPAGNASATNNAGFSPGLLTSLLDEAEAANVLGHPPVPASRGSIPPKPASGICRVWRNPMTILPLDYQLQPLPPLTK